AENGGDILIEAFTDLVGLEKYRGWQFWHDQAAHEFAGFAILFAVSDEEFFQRQRAYALALAQFDTAAKGNEKRSQIAYRRSVGDASADGAGRAHLHGAEPPDDLGDVRADRCKRR